MVKYNTVFPTGLQSSRKLLKVNNRKLEEGVKYVQSEQ